MPEFETGIKVLITVGSVLFLVLIFVLSKMVTNKIGDRIKKWVYVIGYLLNFAIFVGILLYLFWIFKFDFDRYFNDLFNNVILTLEDSLVKIISTILIFFVTFFLLKLSKMSVERIGKKPGSIYRRRRTLAKLTLSIIRYVGWIIAIIIVLALWGVNIGPALAGLGILGLVIGLGAQKFINDLISGLFIIFEQHYDVGDIIESNGFKGEVIDIGLKTTRIKNWKGEVKILANGSISDVINFSKHHSLAIVDFGIAYDADIDKTTKLLKNELPKFSKSYPEIIEDPEILGVIELAGSSVNIRVIAKTLTNQHFNIERQLRVFIKSVLDKHNIEIPFPQVVIHEAKKNKVTRTPVKSQAVTTKSPRTIKQTVKKPVRTVKKKTTASPKPKTPSKRISTTKKK